MIKKLPPLPDPILESFRKTAVNEALETLPWVPEIIPMQMIQIGPVLLVTIPGEITTIAARRLENEVKKQVHSLGVSEVIITSYANGYMGYITTPEEYDNQSYEAGHTVYGRNTLPAITQAVNELIAEFKGESSLPLSTPFQFPAHELARRSF